MATSKNTPKNPGKLPATKAPASISIETPFDIVNDRLSEAYATIDLIYTMTALHKSPGEYIESLCRHTLPTALNSAMLRIEEAREAAGKIGSSAAAVQS